MTDKKSIKDLWYNTAWSVAYDLTHNDTCCIAWFQEIETFLRTPTTINIAGIRDTIENDVIDRTSQFNPSNFKCFQYQEAFKNV